MHEPLKVSDTADRILQTLGNIEQAGASPAIIIRLISMTDAAESDIGEIAKLISREQAIVTQLLKLANSVYFSRGAAIGSVRQAIVHLGTSMVKRLIMAIELIGLFRNNEAFGFFNLRNFFRSSIAGAMIAEELGKKLRIKSREELYIASLLKNFGVLIIRQYFPDIFREIHELAQEKKLPFPVACREVCGLDHRSIAYLLFARWNMPSTILSLFQEEKRRDDIFPLLQSIVSQADYVLQKHNYGRWDAYAAPASDHTDLFAFDEEEFTEWTEACLHEVDEFMMALSF